MDSSELKKLRADLNLTQQEFAAKIGMSLRGLQKIEAGESKMSKGIEALIKATFSNNKEITATKNGDKTGVPVYSGVYSTGSVTSLFMDDHDEKPLFYLDAPEIRGCDCGFRVSGDSMHPLIRNGGYVACKTIINKDNILYGEIYHIITSDYRTVKYVHPHPDKEDWVILKPHNKSIPDTPMKRDEIIRIAQVRGIVQVL